MIDKIVLQSFIDKYYLGGLNNQVKWRIKNKTLIVYAGEMGSVCKVELKKFDFEDADIGVFDTYKLNSLINITQGFLIFKTDKINQLHTKLLISDKNYNLSYTLADTMILPKSTYYQDPDTFEVELILEKQDLNNLVKAKKALAESDKMLVVTKQDEDGNNICEFLFGDQEGFSDKITYYMNGSIQMLDIELPFNAEIFKNILNVNKDLIKGTIKINSEGMMKLNFETEYINSEYYMLRTE